MFLIDAAYIRQLRQHTAGRNRTVSNLISLLANWYSLIPRTP